MVSAAQIHTPHWSRNHGLMPTSNIVAKTSSVMSRGLQKCRTRKRTGRLWRNPRTVRDRQTPIGMSQRTPGWPTRRGGRAQDRAAKRRDVEHEQEKDAEAEDRRPGDQERGVVLGFGTDSAEDVKTSVTSAVAAEEEWRIPLIGHADLVERDGSGRTSLRRLRRPCSTSSA